MFHKATDLKFNEGTVLSVTFQDGLIKSYDVARLFDKYPQLTALNDRDLFTAGKLNGFYGIIWNDDLDLEVDTVYEEGTTVGKVAPAANAAVGSEVLAARAAAGWSQKELSAATGIDQSDISKIERGVANPSVNTLRRIASALGCNLTISIVKRIE